MQPNDQTTKEALPCFMAIFASWWSNAFRESQFCMSINLYGRVIILSSVLFWIKQDDKYQPKFIAYQGCAIYPPLPPLKKCKKCWQCCKSVYFFVRKTDKKNKIFLKPSEIYAELKVNKEKSTISRNFKIFDQ